VRSLSFLCPILDSRDTEPFKLRGMMFLSTGIPASVTLATFGVYVFVQKESLTASTAFTAMSLFSLLREAVSKSIPTISLFSGLELIQLDCSLCYSTLIRLHASQRVPRSHQQLHPRYRAARRQAGSVLSIDFERHFLKREKARFCSSNLECQVSILSLWIDWLHSLRR